MTLRTWFALIAVAGAAATASVAGASAPPIGALPKGPVSDVTTPRGQLVAIALPHRTQGRVWRVARRIDTKVLRQVSEADVGANVIVVFRAAGRGNARVVFALTRGETSRALASATYVVHVR